ncbi:hypothetical protein X758_04330 [Mesorhizobium sp. LSHC416B00]|nr:hypothetical protein [Mesorhizobium sp. LSHC416B00]ESX75406.1 hypothetical protein X758_04330 [Mesorhizobium sp. LSHC416B00]
MTSRFSTLQNRDVRALKPAEAAPVAHHAVVIPTNRKALPPKPETTPGKSANKVLDARVRIHRLLLEEINLVALERLPKDEMRRQVQE